MIRLKSIVSLLMITVSIRAEDPIDTKLYVPNFEQALGKGDFYFGPYYNNRCKHRFIQFTRDLYATNNLFQVEVKKKPRIPLLVHQIWVGGPLPDKYKSWQKTWQELPGWTYKLWTDEEVAKLDIVNRDLYDSAKTWGQKADILRIEILNKFGGLYVDVDFECLQPTVFTLLNKTYDFYTGINAFDCGVIGVNNAIIASIPEHPILLKYIEQVRKAWNIPSNTLYQEVVLKTGPGLFTKAFLTAANKNYLDIALPPSFLYPLGLKQVHRLQYATANVLKQKVCKPESIAIHWWTGSWKKPAR